MFELETVVRGLVEFAGRRGSAGQIYTKVKMRDGSVIS